MMVVDASIAVKRFIQEVGSEQAMALTGTGRTFAAPDLLLLEVANVLSLKTRRHEITLAQSALAIMDLPSLIDTLVPSADLLEETWRWAIQLEHSAYDCAYLACALHLKKPLVTADAKFYAKASRSGCGNAIKLLNDFKLPV